MNQKNSEANNDFKDDDQRFKMNDPVLNKIYSEFYRRKNYTTYIENKQLRLENRNLLEENKVLKQKLSGLNNLMLQLGQQEKYIEALEVQEIQNRHLVDANERHIKEICRYMLLLEYKQQHIQQLDFQQQEAQENSKLNQNEQEILIPDYIQNKSHLTDDDKYYIEKEYQKQKNQLRKREKKQEKNKKKNEDQKHKQDDLSNKIYQ